MGIAERRHQRDRAKAKVVRKLKASRLSRPLIANPTFVGREAACHSRSCSCWMCASESLKPARLAARRELLRVLAEE